MSKSKELVRRYIGHVWTMVKVAGVIRIVPKVKTDAVLTMMGIARLVTASSTPCGLRPAGWHWRCPCRESVIS